MQKALVKKKSKQKPRNPEAARFNKQRRILGNLESVPISPSIQKKVDQILRDRGIIRTAE